MACGMTLLFAGTTVGTSLLAGCKSDKVPTATTSAQTTAQATTAPAVTVPKAVNDLVDKGEIKVDKDGNITDKNGKKVEVKDGKVEVKTDDGKTVTVKVDDVKTTVSNNNNSNKGNTEKKENTSSKKDNTSKTNTSKVDTSKNDNKPASKPNNSSKNDTKPAQKPASKPSESSKTETPTEKPKQKVWVDDYKTVHHEGYWKVVGTEDEPVYEWVGVYVCNNCGMKLTDANLRKQHLLWEAEENGAGAYHVEEEYVQTGTKTVEKKEWVKPWDEKVKDGGHWEYR